MNNLENLNFEENCGFLGIIFRINLFDLTLLFNQLSF
jgi:hypothetical protein